MARRTTTFFMTDVEGSTRLWEERPDDMSAAVAAHDELVGDAVGRHGGNLIKSRGEGDSCFVVFDDPAGALVAAIDVQRGLASAEPPGGIELSVRIGIHTGEAELRDEDFYGPTVNRCARIREIAWGGQILVSGGTADAAAPALPADARLTDLGLHRLRDLTRPERIYELSAPDIAGVFPPVRSLASFPHNIPEQVTSLIGREEDLRRVKEMLDEHRLVTLTGAGGSGKTRLGKHVAADVVEAYPDGAWFVALADVTAPSGVLAAVARVLGVRERRGLEPEEGLISRVRAARMLLVLDNCEHVLDGVAPLVDRLLGATPGLRVLATSREPIGVRGEVAWPVPPLQVPGQDAAGDADLLAWESTRLFVERARAIDPAIDFDGDQAGAVAKVCRRLDGIPLAIELAAARVTVLPPSEIADRLDDRFALLTGGSRTALPHQQTLQATVDWSFALLSDAERVALRRLAVFTGGFTLEAAETVIAGDGVADANVLDLLGRLVSKSLVVREVREGASRFRLLETIRAYAMDKLLESGERSELAVRYLRWCTDLAEAAEADIYGPGQRKALERIEAEVDNLRAALRAVESGPPAGRLRLAAALGPFWWIRGYWTEGRRALDELVTASPEAEPVLLSRACAAASVLASAAEDFEAGRAHAERAEALAEQTGDKALLARAQLARGQAIVWSDLPAAWKVAESGLELARKAEDLWIVGWGLQLLASILGELGEREVGRSLITEALSLRRELGDAWGVSWSLYLLGQLDLLEGQTRAARTQLEECLAIRRELGDAPGTLVVLAELAQIAQRDGDEATAKDLLDEGLALRRRLDERAGAATLQFRLGYAAIARGDLDEARRYFEVALQYRRRLGDPRGIALSLHDLAMVARLQGDAITARAVAHEALSVAQGIDHPATRATCLESFAAQLAAEGDLAGAARAWGAVAGVRARAGVMKPPYSRSVYGRHEDDVRERLGEEVFDAAFLQGMKLSFEEAVEMVSGPEGR